MPRTLINLVGVIITIAIIGLAIALFALPIYLQSLTTSAQTAQVGQTNSLYQAQVDGLRAESERMDEIDASVADLRSQIPATNELDDVFEVIARAASSADVDVQSIAAGDNAAFIVRTEPLAAGEEPEAPADTTQAPSDDATGDAAAEASASAPATAGTALADGRQQVDFTIAVTTNDLGNAVRFLDNLRRGPRLLSSIESVVTPTGTGYDVNISAITFVLPEA
ncbi:hypothetical protein [Microbacterium thalassium]|uniref:Type II secretory pathway pseudopilin PulG n=1 Tax=Microbacterium thalassium TaxID=362649 RepID=A0A7X0KUX6_9MICO|nr:hypothetical protein [Microbacterium thalassium]MBB6391637.1 type II secretory pathway pseudopilin PulG [Microbacterium thalassium]GLK24240.1 hypothetical protein GCM10017607_15580 [Microbacterium thalassium]